MCNASAFNRYPYSPDACPIRERYHGRVPPHSSHFLTHTRPSYEYGYAWSSHAGALQDIVGHYELDAPLLTSSKIGLDMPA